MAIQGFLLVGGPEVFMVIGVALAGKEGLTTIKNAVKRIFGLPAGEYAATRSQYTLGLVMIALGLLAQLLVDYLYLIVDLSQFASYELYVNLGGDVLIILGVFVAGQQLFAKLKSLITWEAWKLEMKKDK